MAGLDPNGKGDARAATGAGMRCLRYCAVALAWLGALALTAWAAAALYFDLAPAAYALAVATVYVVLLGASVVVVERRMLRLGICYGGFLVVLGCWLALRPSNDRPWQANDAQTPWAEVTSDRITIHNFRHCFYRKETDFTCEWLTKEVSLADLRGVDLFVDYWGSPWIAHPIISFQFGDRDYVAASVEARYENGQAYSPVRSFFRQFTIIYVFASESDLIRLRTNYRSGEKVYLFHMKAGAEWERELFLQYLAQANRLHDKPRWFNAVTNNCTTNIFANMAATGRMPAGSSRYAWWVLLNGRAAEHLYRGGNLAGDLPFAQLKERAYINPVANTLGDTPEFPEKIRANRPGFEFLIRSETAGPRPQP